MRSLMKAGTRRRGLLYSAFSEEVRAKLSMIPQGQLLVKFAKSPQPIFVKFPFPPCLPGDQFDWDAYQEMNRAVF